MRVDPTRWSTPGFAEELRGFVEAAVGPVDLEQVKLQPWSSVWRATASDGAVYWAKQNCGSSAFEGELLVLLDRLVPGRVLPVVAVDEGSGLLLSPDQGDVLGFEHDDLDVWTRIVGEWAQLQRDTAPFVGEIATAGVEAMPLAETLAWVRESVGVLTGLAADDPRRLGDRAAARILECLPAVAAAVDVVGALGLPPCLVHNDLHGNNVFATIDDRPLRFFDLGDAVVASPTVDLLVPLGGLADVLTCERDDPRLWRVAQAWIGAWDDVAPAAALRAAMPAAMRLARLGRVEAWLRMVLAGGVVVDDEIAGLGAQWLGTLPDPPLLDTRLPAGR
ncbi:hypothetical protein D9V37_10465 [Nocardioides mangrovicus]|uniref:Aminoglycoside phosphotransferase domain-containing protein n=1 Tax=Nocardioides mangrovicus TaxID=2478913 RepID=A0A3L8P342_9ACTN|nr:phosphotransferase [Nocardioides mangrovicus]RLV48999.1 hypothetical protein D9V37_10465 [Nocardioides mangrovicus]